MNQKDLLDLLAEFGVLLADSLEDTNRANHTPSDAVTFLNSISDKMECPAFLRKVYDNEEVRKQILHGDFDYLADTFLANQDIESRDNLLLLKEAMGTIHKSERDKEKLEKTSNLSGEDQVKALVSEYGAILTDFTSKIGFSTENPSEILKSMTALLDENKKDASPSQFISRVFDNKQIRENLLNGEFDCLMEDYLKDGDFESRDNFELLKDAMKIMKDSKERQNPDKKDTVASLDDSISPISITQFSEKVSDRTIT